MAELEKVIKGLECCSNTGKGRCESSDCPYWIDSICCIDEMQSDALELLKEQEANTPSAGEIAEEMVNYICEHEKVVRCKDCKWRGNKKKCIVAFVVDKQDFPLFFYDNRGNWFCADGREKENAD